MASWARRRAGKTAAVALLLTAVPVSLWSLTYTQTYRAWRWKRAPLPELQRQVARYPDDPTLLYALGARLNAADRYAEALPFLERACGLDLDQPAYRDAWAKALLATGQISRAFAILSQFVQTHPASAEGHLYLARFYVAQNATRRATEELEAATRLNPELTEAWWLQALALHGQNQTAPAIDRVRKAVALEPKNPTFLGFLGELLLTTGDHAGALQALEAARRYDPKYVAAHLLCARIYLDHRGDPAEALTSATRAAELDAENDQAHFLRGRSLAGLRRPGEAAAALERAAALAPDDPRPVMELQRVSGRERTAADVARWDDELRRRTAVQTRLRTLEDAHRQNPDDARTARDLARFWAGRGDVPRTVRYHAKALRSEQDSPRALIAAAGDLTAGGHPEPAVDLLKRVQAQSKMNPASYEAMGDALLATGKAREAALQYETAARWWPEKRRDYQKKLDAFFARQAARPSEAMRLYAQAVREERTRLGPRLSTEASRELLRKAVTLEPNNTQIRREWLRVLFERKERAEAIRAANELLAVSPEDTVAHAMLAVLLVETAATEAEYDAVQFHLNKAKADPVMGPLVYFGAGSLAMRRGQTDAALVALRTARTLAPDSDPICYALAQAERMGGNESKARALLAEYQRRRDEKQAEVDVLNRVAAAPDRPGPYREAIAFYEKRGRKQQAAAVRHEFGRRFRTSETSDTKKAGRSDPTAAPDAPNSTISVKDVKP